MLPERARRDRRRAPSHCTATGPLPKPSSGSGVSPCFCSSFPGRHRGPPWMDSARRRSVRAARSCGRRAVRKLRRAECRRHSAGVSPKTLLQCGTGVSGRRKRLPYHPFFRWCFRWCFRGCDGIESEIGKQFENLGPIAAVEFGDRALLTRASSVWGRGAISQGP